MAAASSPRVVLSTWLMVLARGLIPTFPPFATEFLRTRPGPPPLVLSRRLLFLGRDEGVVVMWSFCWCLRSRSRRAKHLVHSGHSNGFSFVCERSWRLRCSNRANDLEQVPQTCGLGLSVLGGGKLPFVLPVWPVVAAFEAVLVRPGVGSG